MTESVNGYAPTPLFVGERMSVGRFVARPSDSWFADCGPARGHLVVFPRLPVRITHAGKEPVIADATRVMFYNRGQEYRREALTPEGDRCLWLSFEEGDVRDAHLDEPGADGRPFAATDGPGDARSFLLQALVARQVEDRTPDSPLIVEELAMHLLRRAVAAARRTPSRPLASHVELAERLRRVLHRALPAGASLAAIAREARTSPFHAARVFKRHTGLTLHGYLDALRLCRALERLLDGERDLTALALDVGYGSHSHFTLAFRRRFGVPPSEARRLALPTRLAQLRGTLTREPRRAGF